MKEIMTALEKLGVNGNITTKVVTPGRIIVYVNNEYFGMWDTHKKTFVD